MRLEFGYGSGVQAVEVEERQLLGVLRPTPIDVPETEAALLAQALDAPIGAPRLEELVRPGETVAIVTSDITRPFPTARVLPALLARLYRAGVSPEDITLVFALGSHRGHTEEEMRRLTGTAWGAIRCADSGEDGFVSLGTTRRGTPVEIDRHVAEADRRICLGNIEYHYFAGYSGGAKAIMPGVSTRAAIQANHSRMTHPDACVGRLEGNPVREDLEEAAALVGVDFLLNVVLDEHKRIVHAVAGDVTAAHRAGCAWLDRHYRAPISELADIVIASQGGAPKDLNLYQTQKALDNAKHAVKPGGVIILAGACPEGLGENTFQQWMLEARSPQELIRRIQREFRLGGHKAAAIALVLERCSIYLVSQMPPELVRGCFLTPFSTIQEAYDAARAQLGEHATVLAMPYGGSTLPTLTTSC